MTDPVPSPDRAELAAAETWIRGLITEHDEYAQYVDWGDQPPPPARWALVMAEYDRIRAELSVRDEEPRFAELRALKEGWDSYGSAPIQEGVEDRAKAILALLRTRAYISPTSEGGIDLEWRGYGGETVSIEVEPEGGIKADIEEKELEDVSGPNSPLSRLKRAMTRIEGQRTRIADLEAVREMEQTALRNAITMLADQDAAHPEPIPPSDVRSEAARRLRTAAERVRRLVDCSAEADWLADIADWVAGTPGDAMDAIACALLGMDESEA